MATAGARRTTGCGDGLWENAPTTAVGFIRVVPAVVHAITLPDEADAHAVLALEAELITHLVELRVLGCKMGKT